MRKNFFLVTVCFFTIFLSVFFSFGYWNSQQEILKNGDALPTSFGKKTYTLTGAQIDTQTNRYHLEFSANHYDGNLVLIIIQVNSSFTIFKDGKPHYQYAFNDPYKRIQQFPLSEDFFDAKQQKLIIEYTGDQESNQQKIILGVGENIGGGLVPYTTLQLLSIGALLIMFSYAISLFAWKPGERYLSLFIIYIGLLLVWGSLTLLPQYTNSLYSYVIETIINELSILVAFLTVIINFGLLNIHHSHPLEWMKVLYGTIVAYIICSIFVLFDYSSTYKIVQYFRLIGGSVILIYACSKKKKGGWILLIGYAVSQGMLYYSMFMDLGYVPESIYLSFIRASKLSFLPFTFSIMLFINFKFANKFKESEKLAIELKDINKSLDQIVEERTLEMKRQQALRHNMMLNVFHDLRSPLFVLKGCAEIISAESIEGRDKLDIMKERIDFLTNLTNDLFLFEQLEDDKVLFASEQVDLSRLLQTIGSAGKIEASKKGILLQTQLEQTCLVWGDRHRLGQALQNLIINAIYYTPQNGRVTIKMKKTDHSAHIYIKDTGKGISEADIGKVFQRYYHNNETSPHKSTGLGLSIAQEIIKQHHGTISVKSKIGIGSTFEVILPVYQDN